MSIFVPKAMPEFKEKNAPEYDDYHNKSDNKKVYYLLARVTEQ